MDRHRNGRVPAVRSPQTLPIMDFNTIQTAAIATWNWFNGLTPFESNMIMILPVDVSVFGFLYSKKSPLRKFLAHAQPIFDGVPDEDMPYVRAGFIGLLRNMADEERLIEIRHDHK